MNVPRIASSSVLSVVVVCVGLALSLGCSSKGGSNPTAPGGGGGGNHSPTLNVAADSTCLLSGSSCTVRVTASDPDGDQLTLAYSAAGGTVSSSGQTAPTAIFTGTRIGNDSVTVTVSDGHGGQASATARVYVVRAGTPYLSGYAATCVWRATVVPESLYVTAGWASDGHAFHDINVGGNGLPYLLVPGGVYSIQTADPCSVTMTHWQVTLQRPQPDGRSYNVDL